MSTVSSLTVTSLTVEPATLGSGHTDITVYATISYNYNRSIVAFEVDLYRLAEETDPLVSIGLTRIAGSDRWTGRSTLENDVPDTVLTNRGQVVLSFEAPIRPVIFSFVAPEITVRVQRTGVVDTIPPSISQSTVEPQSLGPGQSQLRLFARVTDNVRVDFVHAQINGLHYSTESALRYSMQNDIWEDTNIFREDIPDQELQVTFLAYDYAGNSLHMDNGVKTITMTITTIYRIMRIY